MVFDLQEGTDSKIESVKKTPKKISDKKPILDALKDSTKKQLLLRMSSSLYHDLVKWSEDEFRSINGQIEYLLTEAVKKRKNKENNLDG